MAEAIYELERLGGPGSSQHILIADANTSRGLEISPKGNSYIEPDVNGVIVHTNHFIQNKYVEEVPSFRPPILLLHGLLSILLLIL